MRLGVLAAMLVLGLLYGVNRFASALSFQTFGSIVARVELASAERVVALTFDDGPRRDPAHTLMAVLAAHDAHATFFVQGRELEREPALGRELIAAGHELGNHSYSHTRMLLKSQSFIAQEIERTDRAIRAAGQTGTSYFRPPYGKKLFGLPWYLAQHHRRTIMWDVAPDADSSNAGSAAHIAQQVIGNTRPGSIILLHVMFASCQPSLQAVPMILSSLSAQGYRFVRISELLGRTR